MENNIEFKENQKVKSGCKIVPYKKILNLDQTRDNSEHVITPKQHMLELCKNYNFAF